MPEEPSWTALRAELQSLDQKQLIALIKDLRSLSPANRDFLAAQLTSRADYPAVREAYRQRIREVFFPKRGLSETLDLRLGRKTINEYKKATGDFEGMIDLMLEYVERGTDFTRQYGDIDISFYDSLMSVLEQIVQEFERYDRWVEVYTLHRSRFLALPRAARGIGWGYGDFVHDTVGQLDATYSASL